MTSRWRCSRGSSRTGRRSRWERRCMPARAVGGDLYDFLLVDDMLWFIVADAAGKGVSAALFMAVTRTLFRAVAQNAQTVGAVAERMNTELARDNERQFFVTAIVGRLDLGTGVLTYANAGHPAPLLHARQRPVRRELKRRQRRRPGHPRRRELRGGDDRARPRRRPAAVHRRRHRGDQRPQRALLGRQAGATFTAAAARPAGKIVEAIIDGVNQFCRRTAAGRRHHRPGGSLPRRVGVAPRPASAARAASVPSFASASSFTAGPVSVS